MPKKEFAEIGTSAIKQLLQRIGWPRREIAAQLGITVGAIDKWLANGKLPKDQLVLLERLEIGTLAKGSALSHPDSAIAGQLERVPSGDKPFSNATDAELVDALEARGWSVNLSRKSK